MTTQGQCYAAADRERQRGKPENRLIGLAEQIFDAGVCLDVGSERIPRR